MALVALLRAQPQNTTWRELTEQVRESGSALHVWEHYFHTRLTPDGDHERMLSDAATDLRSWAASGLRFVSVLDALFPRRLLDVVETPPFLITQGQVDPVDEGVSVIGSRAASERGRAIAAMIATHLVETGLTVISGLSSGIDTAAHTAALAAGGRTVAFIGTGSLNFFPPENRDLQRRIASEGAVLSQFWPQASFSKTSFPMRNAVMSGYGLATIVVEASEHSGARIQARKAVEHGRPVVLTDRVVAATSWARSLARCPGVWVASGLRDVSDIIADLRRQPKAIEQALYALAQDR
ncbi:DNA-processing protein DprA [Nocardia sp. NPDC052001]|uniref:DNA-processing protein DprA n=1 Tax=Nocardia sp. NPDC052001 TaxID=3154853 RepID=UPI003417063D